MTEAAQGGRPLLRSAAGGDAVRASDEQAATRRVVALVSSGGAPDAVLARVADEIAGLLSRRRGWSNPHAAILHFEDEDTVLVQAASGGAGNPWTVGARLGLAEHNVSVSVSAALEAPIRVGGELWGVACVAGHGQEVLDEGTEPWLAQLADLVAAAIGNAETRDEAHRLAEEQAALRRVATLAASQHPAREVLTAVATEVGLLLDVDCAFVYRYRGGDYIEGMATWGTPDLTSFVGTLMPLTVTSVGALIYRSHRPERLDDARSLDGPVIEAAREVGIRSSVGCPVVIDGQLWGGLVVHSQKMGTLPSDTETRLAGFTELIMTTVVNVEARAQVGRFADEQGALRRVATLVARQAPAAELFATVAREVATLLQVDGAALLRFEADRTLTIAARWGEPDLAALVGRRIPIGERDAPAMALAAGRPVRVDDIGRATGELAATLGELGVVSSIASPVMVEDRVWGCLTINSLAVEPLPANTEERIGGFTELVAAAIANAENEAKLRDSRARVIRSADDARRRLQRDLHDGAQQRLVHALISLQLARAAAPVDHPSAALIDQALEQARRANSELRDLVHEIMPASLTRGGLRAGLESLVADLVLPVDVHAGVPRLPPRLEVNAYFIVAEALTNIVKHAEASRASVTVALAGDTVTITVEDDGCGGADPTRGTGLLGLLDRVEAIGGTLVIDSPLGRGTILRASLLAGQTSD